MTNQSFKFADFAKSNVNEALAAFNRAEAAGITADSLVIATGYTGAFRGNEKVQAAMQEAIKADELTGDIVQNMLCNVYGMLIETNGEYSPAQRIKGKEYLPTEIATIKRSIQRNMVIIRYLVAGGDKSLALMKDGKSWGVVGSLCVAKGESKSFDETLMKAYWKVASSSTGKLTVTINELRKFANAWASDGAEKKAKRTKKEQTAPVSMVKGLTDAGAALSKESDGAGESYAKDTRETALHTWFELGRVLGAWDKDGAFDAADITALIDEVMESANVKAQVEADKKQAA